MGKRSKCLVAVLLALALMPTAAWADEVGSGDAVSDAEIEVSADGEAARMEGCAFAVEGFECSRTGSTRDIDGASYGYTYRLSGPDRVAVVNTADYAVLYIPSEVASTFNICLLYTSPSPRDA